MNNHEKIDYLELPAKQLQKTKEFFEQTFNWKFEDYGPDYTAFEVSAGLSGGFYKSDKKSAAETGAALIVFFSENLEATQEKIIQAGGVISTATFDFPGGRRFHFLEPSGNEFAVWSDKK